MSIQQLRESPWKSSHPSYDTSVFSIRPAPEFSTAEVVVASLYRAVGFGGYAETEVPKAGRSFDRLDQTQKGKKEQPGKIRPDTWRTVLHQVLESPKQPNQSSKRFLQLCPVVPDVAIYSGSARLAGNSWNPGQLIQRIIDLGSDSASNAEATWLRLFEALSVTESDDIWARWLQEEFQRRGKHGLKWGPSDVKWSDSMPKEDKDALRFPARQFVRDLEAIISAKHSMTRRQWVSLLEAIVRLGSVMHVIWLCSVNEKLWRAVRSILAGQPSPSTAGEIRELILTGDARYLANGNPAVPIIKDYASGYLTARVGLNVVLWTLDGFGVSVGKLSSSSDLLKFLATIERNRERLLQARVMETHSEITDAEARSIACKKGIGSNLIEFARHTLGQRQTANESLRGYDQSYFLRKRGEARNAPWVVSLGPVALLALVHCCLREAAGPRSVQRLRDHLEWYGIQVDLESMSGSDLGRKLRMLGLVLDSPDAESGMLMIPPFRTELPIGGGH
ncbi:MAG: hypothetical protein WAO76_08280 [Georgfuchsia sp.]